MKRAEMTCKVGNVVEGARFLKLRRDFPFKVCMKEGNYVI